MRQVHVRMKWIWREKTKLALYHILASVYGRCLILWEKCYILCTELTQSEDQLLQFCFRFDFEFDEHATIKVTSI